MRLLRYRDVTAISCHRGDESECRFEGEKAADRLAPVDG